MECRFFQLFWPMLDSPQKDHIRLIDNATHIIKSWHAICEVISIRVHWRIHNAHTEENAYRLENCILTSFYFSLSPCNFKFKQTHCKKILLPTFHANTDRVHLIFNSNQFAVTLELSHMPHSEWHKFPIWIFHSTLTTTIFICDSSNRANNECITRLFMYMALHY